MQLELTREDIDLIIKELADYGRGVVLEIAKEKNDVGFIVELAKHGPDAFLKSPVYSRDFRKAEEKSLLFRAKLLHLRNTLPDEAELATETHTRAI